MRHAVTVLVAAVIASTTVAYAAPTTVHHAGRLLDSTGTPLDGTFSLTFSLMDDATAGSSHWSETHPAVTVEHGYYSVVLGQLDPLDDDAIGGDRWLAVSAGNPPMELSRVPLAAVPWSLQTTLAHGVQLDGVAGGASPGTCAATEEGTLRYNADRTALEWCRPDGSGGYQWGDVASAKRIVGDDTSGRQWSDGTVARSCKAYLDAAEYNGEGTGNYLIQPVGFGTTKVRCDMDTNGGGWTLVFRETFTDVEDGPTGAEMNSSAGDPITGEGRIAPIAMFSAIAAADVMYDLETHKLVTPDVTSGNWSWFMGDTSVESSRDMSAGAFVVDTNGSIVASWGTVYHHKYLGSHGEISTNTVWDDSVILDYNTDPNHGWAIWTGANGTYKRLGGYQTPQDVTVRIWLR